MLTGLELVDRGRGRSFWKCCLWFK